MNHGIEALPSGQAIVGRRDEHIPAVIPNIAPHHAEDAVFAGPCHVKFGHRF